MIIEEKKKGIEVGVYQQEIFNNLQEAYKNRFAKYVNEQNYEVYSFQKHEDVHNICESNANAINPNTELKNESLDIETQNIDVIESFKTFIGKEIYFEKENLHISCDKENKEKQKLPFISIQQEKNKQIAFRIISIRNTIFEIKNSIISNYEWINKKKNDITKFLEKLKQIEDILYSIVKFGEFADVDFLSNLKHYKYINNIFIHKEQNVFDIIKKINLTSDNNDLPNRTQILNLQNLVSFQNQLFHAEFQNVEKKVNGLISLLHNSCFEKGENLANILLSICFLFNVGLNENIFKRVMNYVSLEYLKLKIWKTCLKDDIYNKQEDPIPILKSIVNEYYDIKNFKNIFHINIREYDKNILSIYKKLLKNELQTQIIFAEVNKITEVIQRLDENLKKDTVKLKFLFSKLPK